MKRFLSWNIFWLIAAVCMAQLPSTVKTLPFEVTNNSHFPDDQIYVALVGEYGKQGTSEARRVWIDFKQNDKDKPELREMLVSYNTVARSGDQWQYAPIFTKLSDIKNKTLNIPDVYGCRILISFKQPLWIHFFGSDPVAAESGYTGPNLANPDDPNLGIRFEIIELSWTKYGLWANTTRVDAYQYPMGLQIWGKGYAGEDATIKVGEIMSHEQIISRFRTQLANTPFEPCYRPQYFKNDPLGGIIEQPSKIEEFKEGGVSEHYFDNYIRSIWSTFNSPDKHLRMMCGDRGWYTGYVQGQNLVMTADAADDGKPHTSQIVGIPTTQEIIEGKGAIATGNVDDLAFQAQFCGAVNRGAIDLSLAGQNQNVHTASAYFGSNSTFNKYVSFFHQKDITLNGKTYAFAYDDTHDQSSTCHLPAPERAHITIGGFASLEPAGPLSRIEISPETASVLVGGNLQFYAVGRDANDKAVLMSPTWSVNGGGTIDPVSGLFKATTEGIYTVTASHSGVSQSVNVMVSATNAGTECSGVSKESTGGTPFKSGYKYNFTTVGNSVELELEMLDPYTGLVGYIFYNEGTPEFKELGMTRQGSKLKYTFKDQTLDSTLKFRVKIASSSGDSFTKYFTYKVGNNCGAIENDQTPPSGLSVSAGTVGSSSVELLLNATDNSGKIVYTISYNGKEQTVSGNSGVQQAVVISNLTAETQYTFSVVAKDLSGNASEPINLGVKTLASGGVDPNPGGCSGTSKEATEGSFQTGYSYSFVTEGNNVTVVFELLDKKDGLVGYIHDWTTGGLQEKVGNTQGNKVSYTFPNQTAGKELKVACKFAFAGGLATTKAFSYIVGDNCGGSVSDTQAPTNVTAVAGNITANSIQLLINATDNSGQVTYTVTYNGIVKTINGASGVQQSVLIDNLLADTQYAFSVVAKDASGNAAQAVQLNAHTLSSGGGNTNPGGCSGTSKEATEGSFQTGYSYSFVTEGNNVTVVFELLDKKDGLVGYIHDWTTGGLQEKVGNTQGNKVSYTFPNQTAGKELKVACKFAFAGGLTTTKAFSYIVGDNCGGSVSDTQAPTNVTAVASNVTANSIQLLLNATDNSGSVVYTISYDGIVKTINGSSGVQQSVLIENLSADTQYAISVVAKDGSGNTAQAVQVSARTLSSGGGSTNPGGCSGTSKEAVEGLFQTGYTYNFVTEGNNVTVVFELLDNRDGLVGYIHDWTTGGLQERVGNTQGNKVSYTFPNQTIGKELKVGCKFAFAGGLSTTKAFSYIVGSNCNGTRSLSQSYTIPTVNIYPTLVESQLTVESELPMQRIEIYNLYSTKVYSQKVSGNQAYLELSGLSTGTYVIRLIMNDNTVSSQRFIKK